jgi:hypothetical protein
VVAKFAEGVIAPQWRNDPHGVIAAIPTWGGSPLPAALQQRDPRIANCKLMLARIYSMVLQMKSNTRTLSKLLPDFETQAVALERQTTIIQVLERGNPDAKTLAEKLAECVVGARCNLPMCPICVRLLRRSFVLGALACVDEIQSGIKRRAELPITAFSAVLAGETYPVNELNQIDIPLVNRRVQRRHQRAKFALVFAGLDISLNEDGQAKTPPFWQVQVYGVVVGLQVDAVRTEIQRLYLSAASTPRPLRVRECSDLPKAISYTIKPTLVRRVSYIDETGRQNTRKLDLKPRQLRELVLCLGQYELPVRYVLTGCRRYRDRIALNPGARERLVEWGLARNDDPD